jgi:HEAT repeat protein
MAKARSLKDKLAAVQKLRGAAPSPSLIEDLRAALGDPCNFVVAEGAEIVGKAQLGDLAPVLVAAFERFLENPVKRDPLCKAKTAIAEALIQLDYPEEDFFWRGARYTQFEPVWGGEQDTAAPVRVACAFSLVRTRARGVLPYLIDLLCDSEKPARIGAAQALAYSETDAAYLLLRLKARIGDKEPEVISECFSGVLKLNPDEGVPFVAEFLDAPDSAIQEAAILALGDSRRREAFEFLKAFWTKSLDARLKEVALIAVSLLRLAPATDFLLGLVSTDTETAAQAALSALALHRYDERIRERTAAAVAQNGRAALRRLFDEEFRVND